MSAISYCARVAFLSVLLLTGCGEEEAGDAPARPVRAIEVGVLKAILGREFPGRAKAKDDVELSFQVAGPLVTLPVDVGSAVKKGDVIATIDPRDFQAVLENAQGNLARAQANLLAMERGARPEEIESLKAGVSEAESLYAQTDGEHQRNEELQKLNAISKREFDISLSRRDRSAAQLKQAKEALNIGVAGARPEDLEAKRAEIRALEAAVASAKNQLDYTMLAAPFDGEVAARYVNNFQTVQAKQAIVRVLDVSQIEITVQVPENLISLVPQVKKVVCRFDALEGKEFTGQVTKIGSEASETTRTYPVTVQVEQSGDVKILPGMAATVRNQPVEDGGEDAGGDDAGSDKQPLIVPPGAVFSAEAGQKSYVWIIDGDKDGGAVKRREVTTGEMTPAGLAITKGLKRGEWVVIAGVNSLREGQKVKIPQEGGR